MVVKLIVCLLGFAIFFFIKNQQKWMLGINPDPYCVTDPGLEFFAFANDGIWGNKTYKIALQMLSSAVIDAPILILGTFVYLNEP